MLSSDLTHAVQSAVWFWRYCSAWGDINIAANKNDYVYLDKWNGKDVIVRESESINKEKAIMTIDLMTKKIDCIYQSFNTYNTNIRIGRSVCGVNLQGEIVNVL